MFAKMTSSFFLTLVSLLSLPQPGSSFENGSYITTTKGNGRFAISSAGKSTTLLASDEDYPGIIRVLKHLQTDIGAVSGAAPNLVLNTPPAETQIILVGSVDRSPLIRQLVKNKKLNIAGIAGRWEAFLLDVVENPLPGVEQALVIAGSDKRGTIYGVYDLSAKIGVSPWYWWADVTPKKNAELFFLPGRHENGGPAVKYRGIFINDEAPALAGWAHEKFGGFNHDFYEKVFELILRMKANYLWPAMWGRAFYDDDPLNPQLADEYGVVIGTSHHEPLMRAHVEWRRYGSGAWNYDTNQDTLREFWREGIRRMDNQESIISVGMRGDGDEPMTEGTAIALLERIVADQRDIIQEVTGKEPSEIPQLWALYKEVQDYYDKGMRVPDDITLLLCDDNWGNIRKLPKLTDAPRAGGYGIYYHYDYVGGPRNYKWLNTNPIAKVWEQMHLAYAYGVDRIWIVNVGDIKPMEFPTQFFLDYAWNPGKWPAERLPEYTRLWSAQQFGPDYAAEIADILTRYTMYNGRRKPELLSPETYSLVNYLEAETVVSDYNRLAEKAERIGKQLPQAYQDAYFQLVLHPVIACANLNELYVSAGKNRLYAEQGRAMTNDLAATVKTLFDKDAEISRYYNEEVADGKWSHMMDQTHIGYTYWQQPDENNMPKVKTIDLPEEADMGVAIEGSEKWWPNESAPAMLPEIHPFQRLNRYFEIFNRGRSAFDYQVESSASWLTCTPKSGKIEEQQRISLAVDWQKAPAGRKTVSITIMGPKGQKVTIQAVVNNIRPEGIRGFVESNGYIAMEAEHYARAVDVAPVKWQRIPDMGRTLSAMTPLPVTAGSQSPGDRSPHLEYRIHTFGTGKVTVRAELSPTINFHNNDGLRFAISIDDEIPQVINMHADFSFRDWEESVRNSMIECVSEHTIAKPGNHTLKFWMVDAGVVLQRLVVQTGHIQPSYLGPPQSSYFD